MLNLSGCLCARNLFSEQDDPEVQQRIRENASTMTKMQEIKHKVLIIKI
jgi:hypothetical protein